MLLGEPGLGRPTRRLTGRLAACTRGHHPPGQRFYRIRVGQFPARRAARPRRMVSIRWDPTHASDADRNHDFPSDERGYLQALLQRSAPAGQT